MADIQERDFFDTSDDAENEEDLQAFDASILSSTVVSDTDWTTETILSQLKKKNILLDPAFQRRDAWTDERKSRFIESLFLGLPIPQLVFAENKNSRGKYIVIDGKQRLLSLVRFALDEDKPLRLKGLELRNDLNGKTLADLRNQGEYLDDLAAFENQSIRTTIVRNWEREEVLYFIFHRLNSGSVPLSPQELRHALHPGPFIDFAFAFSEASTGLVRLLGRDGKPDFRMRDVEIFIRYVGLMLYVNDYSGDLKRFLDLTTLRLNDSWGEKKQKVEKAAVALDKAIDTTFEVFGEGAFRKWTGSGYERRFNRAVFDIMTFTLSRTTLRREALSRPTVVVDTFKELCDDNEDFRRALETTTKSTSATFGRLRVWSQSLIAALGLSGQTYPWLENL
ncbi:DUF262 domain-containing protein [Paraburkholderia atlantica]|uniref:DUF262 domain-containing protein n=1 Tax=Paraburkholderia atlantica TaxID=2654982 RepID=UPI00036E0008|nr:DUF262 domain-containing protein [Paraburkholderia atlantica]